MMVFSLLGVFLSLLGNLSPDTLPADALAQPMLAGAPGDALVAVYVPDLDLDYGAFTDSPDMAMLFGEWPPEEEDFPKALAAYNLEEIFSLFRSETALFLTPPHPELRPDGARAVHGHAALRPRGLRAHGRPGRGAGCCRAGGGAQGAGERR